MASEEILVIRLGAMGDILHALPAVASLRASLPNAAITWAVEQKWLPLLEDNPCVQHTAVIDRHSVGGIRRSLRALRERSYEWAIDLQGLYKSALVGRLARAHTLLGFDRSQLREPLAGVFYQQTVKARREHVVERNLELVAAAGASMICPESPLPPGRAECRLPEGRFVLASPLAGWMSKQWPREHFAQLARLLQQRYDVPLVVDVPPGMETADLAPAIPHQSSLAGLIYATRRATAVLGVDSGPLHLAAALRKPGVAIFGPTDPARNGPYGGTIAVLRVPDAITTYRRGATIDPSMAAIQPEAVADLLGTFLA